MSALLHVERLGLATKAGPVFAELTFSLEQAALSVVLGPSGSGRSALLLAVCGRMKGVTGSVRLGSHPRRTRPGDLRRRTAVARLATLVGPEDKLTVAESVTERALVDGVQPARAAAAFALAEGALGVTFPRTSRVEELGAYEQALLCVALAGLRPADLVVLDDADRGLDVADQTRLFEALQRLCSTGWTVLAASTEPAAVPADVPVVVLPARPPQPQPPAAAADPAPDISAATAAAPHPSAPDRDDDPDPDQKKTC